MFGLEVMNLEFGRLTLLIYDCVRSSVKKQQWPLHIEKGSKRNDNNKTDNKKELGE